MTATRPWLRSERVGFRHVSLTAARGLAEQAPSDVPSSRTPETARRMRRVTRLPGIGRHGHLRRSPYGTGVEDRVDGAHGAPYGLGQRRRADGPA